MRQTCRQLRVLVVATLVMFAGVSGAVVLSTPVAGADTLDDGSLTDPSTGDAIYAANSTEKKSITYGYTVDNVTNTGESVEIFLTFPDEVNNSAGKLSSFSGNVTCKCDGSRETVSISSSASIVDGPDGDGVKETVKIGVQPNKKDKPLDLIVNFTGDATWPEVEENVEYDLKGAVIEPNENAKLTKFEDITVAGGLYTQSGSATADSESTATLSGDLWNLNGSSSVDVRFRYWEKGNKQSTTEGTSYSSVTSSGGFSQSVSGLKGGTTYVAVAEVENGSNNDLGREMEFSTPGLNVDTKSASSVDASTATLNGDLTALGNESSVDVRFRYWEKGNKANTYSGTSFQSKSSTGSFSQSLSSLKNSTTYVYVAEVEQTDGDIRFGKQKQFTTGGLDVESNSASNVVEDSADLNANLTGLGEGSSVDVRFRYWEKGNKASTYSGTSFQSKSSTGSFSQSLSGLKDGTTYVYVAEADGGGYNDFGEKLELSTPVFNVDTNSASSVGDSTATLNGDLTGLGGDSSVDVRFRYWEKGNKQATYTVGSFTSTSSTGSFSDSVSGLKSGTTYVFVAEVEQSDGDNDFGQKLEFTTSSPNVQSNGLAAPSSGSNGELVGVDDVGSAGVHLDHWTVGTERTTGASSVQSASSTGSVVSSLSETWGEAMVVEIETPSVTWTAINQ